LESKQRAFLIWGAHASRVLVAVSRRNALWRL